MTCSFYEFTPISLTASLLISLLLAHQCNIHYSMFSSLKKVIIFGLYHILLLIVEVNDQNRFFDIFKIPEMSNMRHVKICEKIIIKIKL